MMLARADLPVVNDQLLPGRFRPTRPEAYSPESVERLKELLADALEREIRIRDIKPAQIQRLVPAIRRADVTAITSGDGAGFGIKKLAAIAEAVGLRVEYTIRGVSS